MDAMWIWGILGLVLLGVEIATGTFYAFWFSISALIVALLLWLHPGTSYATQFTVYAILSLITLIIWRRYYKKTDINSRVGQSQGEEIGRIGTVIDATSPTKNGAIQFTQGLMGSREWVAVSDETIEAGSSATVVAVEGNALRISKVN